MYGPTSPRKEEDPSRAKTLPFYREETLIALLDDHSGLNHLILDVINT